MKTLALILTLLLHQDCFGWSPNSDGKFVAFGGEVDGRIVYCAVNDSSQHTYFATDGRQWNLDFIDADESGFTILISYFLDDQEQEKVTMTIPRGKVVDVEIPAGQKFRAFFTAKEHEE